MENRGRSVTQVSFCCFPSPVSRAVPRFSDDSANSAASFLASAEDASTSSRVLIAPRLADTVAIVELRASRVPRRNKSRRYAGVPFPKRPPRRRFHFIARNATLVTSPYGKLHCVTTRVTVIPRPLKVTGNDGRRERSDRQLERVAAEPRVCFAYAFPCLKKLRVPSGRFAGNSAQLAQDSSPGRRRPRKFPCAIEGDRFRDA